MGREASDFETTVSGIPCGVVIDHIVGPKPWKQHHFPGAGPGDCDPPEPAEVEFHLVDRRGYRAAWLEEKLTRDDEDRIWEIALRGG